MWRREGFELPFPPPPSLPSLPSAPHVHFSKFYLWLGARRCGAPDRWLACARLDRSYLYLRPAHRFAHGLARGKHSIEPVLLLGSRSRGRTSNLCSRHRHLSPKPVKENGRRMDLLSRLLQFSSPTRIPRCKLWGEPDRIIWGLIFFSILMTLFTTGIVHTPLI